MSGVPDKNARRGATDNDGCRERYRDRFMTAPSIIGILFGLIGGLCMSLPKWRLLGGLVALWMIVTGINLLPLRPTSFSTLWMGLGGGALLGFGVGYFLRGFWLNLSKAGDGQMNKGEEESRAQGDKP